MPVKSCSYFSLSESFDTCRDHQFTVSSRIAPAKMIDITNKSWWLVSHSDEECALEHVSSWAIDYFERFFRLRGNALAWARHPQRLFLADCIINISCPGRAPNVPEIIDIEKMTGVRHAWVCVCVCVRVCACVRACVPFVLYQCTNCVEQKGALSRSGCVPVLRRAPSLASHDHHHKKLDRDVITNQPGKTKGVAPLEWRRVEWPQSWIDPTWMKVSRATTDSFNCGSGANYM